jgi:hypothetical protein
VARSEAIMASDRLRGALRHPLLIGGVALLVLGIVADRGADWAGFSSDGRLNMARTSTEDGPYHPRGVPPDIR